MVMSAERVFSGTTRTTTWTRARLDCITIEMLEKSWLRTCIIDDLFDVDEENKITDALRALNMSQLPNPLTTTE